MTTHEIKMGTPFQVQSRIPLLHRSSFAKYRPGIMIRYQMSKLGWERQEEGIRMLKANGSQVQIGQAGNRHKFAKVTRRTLH